MDEESNVDEPAAEFIRPATEADVYRTLVDVASNHFPADLCKVAVVEGDVLVPRARSDDRPADPNRELTLHGTGVGHAVTSGTSTIIDDLQFTRSAATSGDVDRTIDPEQPRSVVAVPIDDDGVLIGTASRPGVFTPSDRETAERFVSYAVAALDRVRSDAERLRDRDPFIEFGSILAHDLRGPLGVARGYTEHVRGTGTLDHLDAVVRALDRMDEMITDLRNLAESGHQIDAKEDVSVADVASRSWTTIAGGRAALSIDGDLEIRADRSQLCHLFENLFRNAIDHGGDDVTVTVGSLADGFYVEDTGPGIPPGLADDPFDPGVTTSENGTGYGLAIVKRIVDAHGWTILITDGSEGGARLEITDVR